MAEPRSYIAVDLGAESGRVMLGAISDGRLTLDECRRFANGPIEQDGSLHWDFPRLFSEIKQGISQAIQKSPYPVSGIGVDSWGVDYGLIDADGALIENPYHYRDSRTNGMMEKVFELVPKREVYEQTGLQFMQLNTLYQMMAHKTKHPEVLAKAKSLIFTADLVSYHLCGKIYADYSLASTSQMMNMKSGQWNEELLEKLGLPIGLMPKVIQPGTVIGTLKPELAKELNCEPIDVIAAGSHDTACAVAAVPAGLEIWAYLSCGTWSLLGAETPSAIINDKTYKYSFTNEGGVEHTIRLLKNIMGLWLLQECRRQWQRQGVDLDYSEITRMARQAQPFKALIDPDDPVFLSPGDMPSAINGHLKRTGQSAIEDKGQMARVILESLALKYRQVTENLEAVLARAIDVVHMVGGGIQNELLCQFTADATGKRVFAGPIEATASGNILMQARAKGHIASLEQGRSMIRNSFEIKTYQPEDVERWDEQYCKSYV